MVRPKGKGFWYLWVVPIVVIGYFLFWGIPHSAQSQEESTCISCHTSVKDLVKITSEIAAKATPQESTETAGEG
jgi:nitrate/TMAO reductase-like tetraheme cytochrome c subunit